MRRLRSLPRSKDMQRSKVANGKVLIPGIDQRSTWVRRCRELLSDHIGDLGGAESCSAAAHSIARRASVLSVELELLEQRFALAGQASTEDLDLYSRASANLRRMLETLHGGGLQRRSKDITPSLSAIIREDADRQRGQR